MAYQAYTVMRAGEGIPLGMIEAQSAEEAIYRLCGGEYGRADYVARSGCDRPMAERGLASYRYRNNPFGFVMIGARDREEALREAARSITGEPDPARLEVWSCAACAYEPAT